MLKIRIKVTKVDMNGFLGRDHHPSRDDEGVEGTVTNIDFVPDEDLELEAKGYQVLYVSLDNGHNVELLGHEFDLVSCVHDKDL